MIVSGLFLVKLGQVRSDQFISMSSDSNKSTTYLRIELEVLVQVKMDFLVVLGSEVCPRVGT